MAFSSNPLSLSVPDQAFESWLRDSGHLDLLDHRTSAMPDLAPDEAADSFITGGFFASLFSRCVTLLSLLTINPFSKLSALDFSGETPSWTLRFFGSCGSYSFPSSAQQAKMRVHENVKRFARNYATLFIVVFACTLYQMPLALAGLLASLALWELFKFCGDKWRFDRYPLIQQILVRSAQCATAVILMILNVQMALFCALAVSYTVMILHAAFRKLTPAKKAPGAR